MAFWRANAATLARAEAEYGVPAEIIVAIIGVETFYGRNTGSYRVIDALATLAFDYPRRAPFFRGELREYLLLAHEQGWSPLVPRARSPARWACRSSCPAAIAGSRSISTATAASTCGATRADVIGSVANYLARHDWLRGQPVLLPARIAPEARDAALRRLDGGISERRPLSAWSDDGVAPEPLPLDVMRRSGRTAAAGGAAGERRGARELLDRVSQFLRDHALQQEPPLRRRRVRAGAAIKDAYAAAR